MYKKGLSALSLGQTHYGLVFAEESLSSRLKREVITYAEFHAAISPIAAKNQ